MSPFRDAFRAMFGSEPRVYLAPGRVNLIGEHTDYNGGFVMPAALDRYTWVAITPRADRHVRVWSESHPGLVEFNLDALTPGGARSWDSYVRGVAWAIERSGLALKGADLMIRSTVPEGSGLSSSAALEVATGFALAETSGHTMDRLQLAKLCQQAENDFVGMRCGIMDQYIACHAVAETALLLDCRSLEHRTLALSGEVAILVANTMVKHELASSAYNERRAQCEQGVTLLQGVVPEIQQLRDVTPQMLIQHRDLLPETVLRRCRHVVLENRRAQEAARALERRDPTYFGELMWASHASLRDDYQVSCAELDEMVEIARAIPGILGSRMTGGGFGGCTVSIAWRDQAATAAQHLGLEYERRTGRRPDVFTFVPGAGAGPAGG
jgi:galactokinase